MYITLQMCNDKISGIKKRDAYMLNLTANQLFRLFDQLHEITIKNIFILEHSNCIYFTKMRAL